jgi:hypothetical protein
MINDIVYVLAAFSHMGGQGHRIRAFKFENESFDGKSEDVGFEIKTYSVKKPQLLAGNSMSKLKSIATLEGELLALAASERGVIILNPQSKKASSFKFPGCSCSDIFVQGRYLYALVQKENKQQSKKDNSDEFVSELWTMKWNKKTQKLKAISRKSLPRYFHTFCK